MSDHFNFLTTKDTHISSFFVWLFLTTHLTDKVLIDPVINISNANIKWKTFILMICFLQVGMSSEVISKFSSKENTPHAKKYSPKKIN